MKTDTQIVQRVIHVVRICALRAGDAVYNVAIEYNGIQNKTTYLPQVGATRISTSSSWVLGICHPAKYR